MSSSSDPAHEPSGERRTRFAVTGIVQGVGFRPFTFRMATDLGLSGWVRLADHVVVTRSEHIPRIQEAQASAYHVLRELVELAA
jgi:hypothetical protein